jgi:hypothetical protein
VIEPVHSCVTHYARNWASKQQKKAGTDTYIRRFVNMKIGQYDESRVQTYREDKVYDYVSSSELRTEPEY